MDPLPLTSLECSNNLSARKQPDVVSTLIAKESSKQLCYCPNQLIDKDSCSLTYVTIDHAIDIIKQCGSGAWLCKVDISDAFKQIPIHPNFWRYFGFK